MSLVINKQAIKSKGGLEWFGIEVDQYAVTQSSAFFTGSYRVSSDFEYDRPLETTTLEDGTEIPIGYGNKKIITKIKSAQDDAVQENFILNEAPNKFYQIWLNTGTVGSGKSWRFYPLSQFDGSYKVSAPGRDPEISFTSYTVDWATSFTPIIKPNEVSGSLSLYTVSGSQASTRVNTNS